MHIFAGVIWSGNVQCWHNCCDKYLQTRQPRKHHEQHMGNRHHHSLQHHCDIIHAGQYCSSNINAASLFWWMIVPPQLKPWQKNMINVIYIILFNNTVTNASQNAEHEYPLSMVYESNIKYQLGLVKTSTGYNKSYTHSLCFVVFCCGLVVLSFTYTLQGCFIFMGYPYDCVSTIQAIVKNIRKQTQEPTRSWWYDHANIKNDNPGHNLRNIHYF